MEIILNARKLLKDAVARLADQGAMLHETKASNLDVRLQNNHSWLRRISISHKVCEEWLDFMNLDLLKTGNVVINFGPKTKTLRGYGPDDEDLSISAEESLYMNFFDIGSAFDPQHTRRMHMRLTKSKIEDTKVMHGALKEVLVRSMAHYAILDKDHVHRDNPNAGTAAGAYSVSLWVGTWSARQKHLAKTAKK